MCVGGGYVRHCLCVVKEKEGVCVRVCERVVSLILQIVSREYYY